MPVTCERRARGAEARLGDAGPADSMHRIDPYALFLSIAAAAFVWSAIRPVDYGVWIFELSAMNVLPSSPSARYPCGAKKRFDRCVGYWSGPVMRGA